MLNNNKVQLSRIKEKLIHFIFRQRGYDVHTIFFTSIEGSMVLGGINNPYTAIRRHMDCFLFDNYTTT
jgi:hypothetical protein